ncbi:MAG: hypothetical protein IPL26_22235 [Leptospiraceae bacterium]|nr:hypothetical protein [Leptospiraceae bacterium]
MRLILEKKYIFNSLLVLLMIFPFAFSFQGIDFTDFGYWVSCYYFFFNNPESVSSGISMVYLSIFWGGLIMKLGENLGAYSIRFAFIFELYIIYYLVYKILSSSFNKTISLFAICLSAFFLYDMDSGAMNWLSYNDLTTLYFTIIIFLLHKFRNSRKVILLSGIFAGMSSLLRITNIASFLFISVFLLDYFYNKNLKLLLIHCLNYFWGFILGFGLVLVISFFWGHLSYILSSYALTAKFQTLSAVHSPGQILLVYLIDILDSFRLSIYLFIYPAILLLLYPLRKFVCNIYIAVLAGLVFAIMFMFGDFQVMNSIKDHPIFHFRWLFWNVGVIYFLNIFLFFTVKRIALKRALLLGLIFLFITPLGSGRSLLNSNFGLYLTLPLLLCIFYKGIFPIRKLINNTNFRILFNSTFSFVLLIYSFQLLSREVYRDSTKRANLKYPLKSEKLKFLLTTKERAIAINALTDAIKEHITNCDSLLAMDYVAFGNYLADCKPYLNNPNPMYFSSEVFIYLMQESKKNPVFPYIITAKVNLGTEWKPIQGRHPDVFYQKEFEKMHFEVQRLKKDGNYTLVWEDDNFQIYKPEN